ncbi:MAG: TonB-dependent receptor [Steroidobacteraceae bacterium]|jgi:outer membrane receptor protein involved in Fe transport|nr:TonB-dependent receptor [Steroidobacteraceae bacterium]
MSFKNLQAPLARRTLRTAIALALAAVAAPALADDQAGVLEEVLVTAQKKSAAEDAQSVPIAVTGFSGEQLDNRFAISLVDVGFSMPNVNLAPQGTVPGVANFVIRGMGTAGQSIPSSDPAVGVVIDGVPFGLIYGVVTDMFDLESVEVLRGPQGTLFGRNVTGGAIVMRSTRPGDELQRTVRVGLGSHELREVNARISGPLSEQWGAKVAVLYKDRDGLYRNTVLGGRQGAQESLVVRPALSFDNGTFDATLIGEHGKVEGDGPSARNFFLFGASIDPYAEQTTRQTTKGRSDLEWSALTLETNWDLWGGTVTGVLGWRDVDQDSFGDIDGAPNTVRFEFGDGSGLKQDQQSVELRWAGSLSDALSLTAGVNLFRQEYEYRERRLLTDAVDRRAKSTIDHDTAGVFAQADWKFAPAWTLTLGGRYSTEKKEAAIGVIGDPTATGNCANRPLLPLEPRASFSDCRPVFFDDKDWSNFSPRVALAWQATDDAMLYGSFSRGFRSGGYNVRFTDATIVTRPANPASTPGPYDEETVDAIEVGLKSEWFDNRVRLNVAVFQNEYTDLQRSANNQSGVQTIFNAADATMEGFELETQAVLAPGLTIEGSYGYVKARYDSARYLELARGRPADTFRLQMVPSRTWNAAANWEHDVGAAGTLRWRASYAYVGDTYADDFNFLPLRDYSLVDASVTFRNASENLSVALYGRNLTDEVYFNFGFDNTAIGSRTMWLSPPRTWGVELTYDF